MRDCAPSSSSAIMARKDKARCTHIDNDVGMVKNGMLETATTRANKQEFR